MGGARLHLLMLRFHSSFRVVHPRNLLSISYSSTILINSHDTSSPLYERAGKPSCGDGHHVLKRNIKQTRRHGQPEAVNGTACRR